MELFTITGIIKWVQDISENFKIYHKVFSKILNYWNNGDMVLRKINLNPVAGNIILLCQFYKDIFGVYLRQTLNFSISPFWRVLLSSDQRVSVYCTFILFE
jgi:hypothetical protein